MKYGIRIGDRAWSPDQKGELVSVPVIEVGIRNGNGVPCMVRVEGKTDPVSIFENGWFFSPASLVADSPIHQLLDAQPEGIKEALTIVYASFSRCGGPYYTLADIKANERLQSKIHQVEFANLVWRLGDEQFSEGKPELDESYTVYAVGSIELETPDDFDPVRYV